MCVCMCVCVCERERERVLFRAGRAIMGEYVNGWPATVAGCLVSLLLVALNILLIIETFLP